MYAVSTNPTPSLDDATLSSSFLSSPFLSSHLNGDDMSSLDSFHWYDQLSGLPEPELEFSLPPAAPTTVVPAPLAVSVAVPVPASTNNATSKTLPVFSSCAQQIATSFKSVGINNLSSISAGRQTQPQERLFNTREQYESLLSVLMKKNSRQPSDKPVQTTGCDQTIFYKSCDFPLFYSPFHVLTPSTPEISSFIAPAVPQDLIQEDEQQQSLPAAEHLDTSNDLPSGATSPGSSTHDSNESLSYLIDGIDTDGHASVGTLEPEVPYLSLELDSTFAVAPPQQPLLSLPSTSIASSASPLPSSSSSSLSQPSSLPGKAPSSRAETKKTAAPYNSRLHTCSVCDKLIRGSKANLTRHMLIHKGQLPFECPHCQKRFRQSSNLEVHMKAHTLADAPYQCSLCGVRYKFLSSLHRHQGEHNKYPEKYSASC